MHGPVNSLSLSGTRRTANTAMMKPGGAASAASTYVGRMTASKYRRSAGTRSWEKAEDKRRELAESFARGATAPTVTRDDRKTIDGAVDLFLLEKKTEGVKGGVYKKYDRELHRLASFMEARSKFFPADMTKELLTEYRATWDELYPSSATRQQVQARVRRFLRFCHDAGWSASPGCPQSG